MGEEHPSREYSRTMCGVRDSGAIRDENPGETVRTRKTIAMPWELVTSAIQSKKWRLSLSGCVGLLSPTPFKLTMQAVHPNKHNSSRCPMEWNEQDSLIYHQSNVIGHWKPNEKNVIRSVNKYVKLLTHHAIWRFVDQDNQVNGTRNTNNEINRDSQYVKWKNLVKICRQNHPRWVGFFSF